MPLCLLELLAVRITDEDGMVGTVVVHSRCLAWPRGWTRVVHWDATLVVETVISMASMRYRARQHGSTGNEEIRSHESVQFMS